MIRDPDLIHERFCGGRRRVWRSCPGWFVSLGLHALLCVCCLVEFQRPGAVPGLQGGAGEEPALIITMLGAATSGRRAEPELSVTLAAAATDLERTQTADLDNVARPRDDVASAASGGETADPPQMQDPLPEGRAVPEPVALNNDSRARRSIKPQYAQLLQGSVAPQSARSEVSGGRSAGTHRRTGGSAGKQNATTFFEITGHGNRFCYVVDCSSSMEEENAIGVARAELLASLEQLDVTQQFQILFYDSELHPMLNGRQHTFYATDAQRKFARQFIASQQPTSGTIHKPALVAALKMKPDVIYFLTDGHTPEMTFKDLRDLQQMNRQRVQIHVVEFGIGAKLGAPDWLEKLAQDHHGSYCYQNVTGWQAP